jgi:hypothetical protein
MLAWIKNGKKIYNRCTSIQNLDMYRYNLHDIVIDLYASIYDITDYCDVTGGLHDVNIEIVFI